MSEHKPVSSSEQSEKLRVVNVAYLNSAPYRALRDVECVDYLETPPAECARMLHEEEADLALIPIAELFAHGGYHFLPFGIAARGPVESVHLFSECPIEKLEAVYVDNTSYSSASLMRILLAELAPRTAKKVKLHRTAIADAIPHIGGTAGALVIGDLSLQLKDKFSHRLDLAEAWNRMTGKPFVFAVWAYRPNSISSDRVRALTSAIELGLTTQEIFAREWADEHDFDRAQAERYVTERILYRLDEDILGGAEEFRRRGIRAHLFPDSIPDSSSIDKNSPGRFAAARTIDALLSDSSSGLRLSMTEGMLLARRATLADLSLASDLRKQQLHSDPGVSYIVDRNINYTNVCNVYCRFCAFFRAPERGGRTSKKSEGGYLLSKEEIGKKIEETIAAGGRQILLQGGLNPELGIEYYEDLFRWIKSNYPIHLHALSADEILHIAKVSHLSYDQVFDRLIAAGLASLPGGGAEILVDRVRRRVARLKSPTKEWLEVHRVAHRKGLRSTCTMMFGVQETWDDRVLHLTKLRQLQDETGGFTAFITWPFQDENVNLKRGDTTSSEYLRVQAFSRLYLDNIANIQSSWVTMGPSIGQTALFFGANDFGSVMLEENVVSAAGTTYCMDGHLIERHIREAGFYPWRRNMHYQPA
ncbi:MAG: cyclic dehypoxanthinyl futalosine synthase [Bdellovibrionota bacterium]